MALDPSIILGIKPVKIEQEDPIEQYSKRLQFKQMLQAGQQQDQAIADENAMRQAYQQSGGDFKKLKELLSGGGQYKQVQALEKAQLEKQGKQVGIDKDQYEITAKAIAQHRDQLANVNNPQQAAEWVMAGYRDPYTGPIMARLVDPQTAIARIPSDPQGFQQWKQQSALGATKFIEMNKPHISNVDTGGSINVLSTPGLIGQPQVIGQMRKTATPGEMLVNTRAQEKNRLESKAPSGYRFNSDGNLEAIPGGPADLKATAEAEKKAVGSSDVELAITTLRDAYNRLEKGGGITSTNKGTLSNLAAAASSSGLGQAAGRAIGTQNQSARNDIAMTRPALLSALMKATGMSAKQMDSNAELKLWLATATDPTLDVESNRRALDNIEKNYLRGNTQQAPQKTVTRTGNYGGKKVVQYSDGSIEYADQ